MNSIAFYIGQAVVAQLQILALEAGVGCLENPPLPLDLQGKDRAFFLLQRGDRVLDQPGQRREKRRLRVLMGAVALTADSWRAADALHFAARAALRTEAFRAALRAAGEVGAMREVEIEPELKDIVTEGSSVMSALEFDYFQTYPNAA